MSDVEFIKPTLTLAESNINLTKALVIDNIRYIIELVIAVSSRYPYDVNR